MIRLCARLLALVAAAAFTPAAAASASYQPGGFDRFGNRDLVACAPDRVGTDGTDHLVGGAKPDPVRGERGLGVLGLGGNDTITGKADGVYGDCLSGGAGSDVLAGGLGGDTLRGDNGNDRLAGGSGRDIVDGGDGADVISGGSGDDVLDGEAGPDTIRGGDGNDWITGGAERNSIDAGTGSDKVSSANGIAEMVRCGSGHDEVWADANDRLVGCERVHRIASLYPSASPALGKAHSVFAAEIRAPFTTATGAGVAGYVFDVATHPNGAGCGRMTLPPGVQAGVGQRVVAHIRSTRRVGFCPGLYRGTITFSSSDTNDDCETRRDAAGDKRKLDECDLRVVLGRFTFRVR